MSDEMLSKQIRVVTDEADRRWVVVADVPELQKLGLPYLTRTCPEVAHFDDTSRPKRSIPVDRIADVLVARGLSVEEAGARREALVATPLTGTRRARCALVKLSPESTAAEPVVGVVVEGVVEAPVFYAPLVKVIDGDSPGAGKLVKQ